MKGFARSLARWSKEFCWCLWENWALAFWEIRMMLSLSLGFALCGLGFVRFGDELFCTASPEVVIITKSDHAEREYHLERELQRTRLELVGSMRDADKWRLAFEILRSERNRPDPQGDDLIPRQNVPTKPEDEQ